MKREDIEKAAADYSGMTLGFKGKAAKMEYNAFLKGAECVIDKLCSITDVTGDNVIEELREYIMEKPKEK